MNAYVTNPAEVALSNTPPVLLAATSDAAMSAAERTVLASGFRIGARLPLASAKARIEEQPALTALWVELDRDNDAVDELLDLLARDADRGRYAAVVSTSVNLLDAVSARLGDSDVELIADASEADRTAAISVATTRRSMQLSVQDIAGDKNAERLRQLSEEVSRIASTLARLSAGPGAPRPALKPPPVSDTPQLSPDTVRNVIRARRLRARFFSEELFADPAWDMLLDLLQAEIAQLRVPVSSLCIAAAVPATTALRWLKALVSQGLFVRRADPHDGRRVFVELAPEASHALRRYFAEVGPVAVI